MTQIDFAATQLFSHGPSARHAIIETHDPIVVNDRFALEFAPHQFEVTNRRPFRTVAHKARMDRVTLYQVSSSADVRITTRPVGDYFIFYIPLRGRVRIKRTHGTVNIAPGQIGIINPSEQYCLRKLDDCTQLTLKVRRADIEREARELFGDLSGEPFAFKADQPISVETCPLLLRLLDMIYADLFAQKGSLGNPDCAAAMETLLARLILREMPSNYVALPQTDAMSAAGGPAPYYVTRAEKAIGANARRDLTVAELVEVSGVSARSLYAGFQRFRGVSPMRYLKEVRLERVRAELIEIGRGAAERRTLTAIAGDWGFHHMGDFSSDYRQRFGELPSETLRKAGR